jgi:hypothetical protein
MPAGQTVAAHALSSGSTNPGSSKLHRPDAGRVYCSRISLLTVIIIMLPNQAIASTPSAPRPSGAYILADSMVTAPWSSLQHIHRERPQLQVAATANCLPAERSSCAATRNSTKHGPSHKHQLSRTNQRSPKLAYTVTKRKYKQERKAR